MSRYVVLLLLVAGVLVSGCGKRKAQVVTPALDPAAVSIRVDQSVITHGQIQEEAMRLFQNVARNVPEEQLPAVQQRLVYQAIENLLVRQLVRTEMERSDILISQEEVEQGKRALEQSLGSEHSLATLLAQSQLSAEGLEENLRLDLFKNKVLHEELSVAREGVTEEKVRSFYEEHPDRFLAPAGRLASHILVKVSANYTSKEKAEARAKAEKIRVALLEGADFERLAREESDCASRYQNGNVGLVVRGNQDPAFEAAVYSQEVGEVGEVVESSVGYHVIRVTGEQGARVVPFEEAKGRLREMLWASEQQRITQAYLQGLREKATITFEGALSGMMSPRAPVAGADGASGAAVEGSVEAGGDGAP